MNNIAVLLTNLLLTFACMVSACSSTQSEQIEAVDEINIDTGKILIVYLSRTDNTKTLAEMIRGNVGGTLMALELEKPYPQNYRATVAQVSSENESGFLPPLKTKIEGMEKYDVIFIGFPTWGMKLPPPMKSFLKQYDLGGKTIIPFNTNGGYGIGSSFETVEELCPKSAVMEGFTTKGGSERDGQLLMIQEEKANQTEIDVKKWLQKLKMI